MSQAAQEGWGFMSAPTKGPWIECDILRGCWNETKDRMGTQRERERAPHALFIGPKWKEHPPPSL